LLILKWNNPESSLFSKDLNRIATLIGYKIAIPQDEYINTKYVCDFILKHQIKSIFTCLFEEDFEKVYPRSKTGLEHYITVFPGYADDSQIDFWKNKTKPHNQRKVDIGYRARRTPFYLGELGTYKWRITDKFLQFSNVLKINISNKAKDVIVGDKWVEFLSDCRCVLGTESGASLHDPEGMIRLKVEVFLKNVPNASFEEVKLNCFPQDDWNINLATLSPRHFEACILKNCQILFEGKYAGVLKAGIHYIEVKKDWTNLQEVINKVTDIKYCEQIADQAYKDLIDSKLYTYSGFVELIMNHCKSKVLVNNIINEKNLGRIQFRHNYPLLASPFKTIKNKSKSKIRIILRKLSLTGFFDKFIYR
ncbi:MAG: hypothetical protein M3Q56_04605, partial [Bacteroidota bacterium]|nr:hypothetical protein [Bacteroidota bacterium]